MTISDKDMSVLRSLWKRPSIPGRYRQGGAWEPKGGTNLPYFDRMVAAGFLKRVDGRCGFEAFKDSMIAWTDAGRSAMEAIDKTEVVDAEPA